MVTLPHKKVQKVKVQEWSRSTRKPSQNKCIGVNQTLTLEVTAERRGNIANHFRELHILVLKIIIANHFEELQIFVLKIGNWNYCSHVFESRGKMDKVGIAIMNVRPNRLEGGNLDFAAALLELVSLKSATKHSAVNQFCRLCYG